MSEKCPRINASQMVKVLTKLGFAPSRQSGSHRIFRSAEGRRVTVPYHSGTILHPKGLKSILDDAGITNDDLRKLL